jgi:hypothetical protein
MPHNVRNAADISLTVMGGLCTEMAPSDLPQGASPLNWDVDYLVGSVRTRDGLASVYSFAASVPAFLSLGNLTPDSSSFASKAALALTNWNAGLWEFTPGQTASLFFTVKIPTDLGLVPNAMINLDIFCADSGSHTADFSTADADLTTQGNLNVTLTATPVQMYVTPSSAYQRNTLSFPIQSAFSSGDTLVCQVKSAPVGTQPTSSMFVFPYFSINLAS